MERAARIDVDALASRLRAELSAHADPAKASQMQRYMKSQMPYLGVGLPATRRVVRGVFGELSFATAANWQRTARQLWDRAGFREERYAAIALTGLRACQPFQTMEALPLYEHFIVSGAWWDFVDEVAAHRLVWLLEGEPRPMRTTLRAWSRGDDLWKRRSAIICQITRKERTDVPLLYELIEPSLDSREFFLRKAIGWALRAHAWTDPNEISRYVHEHASRLSPLSRREALKNVDRPRAPARRRA